MDVLSESVPSLLLYTVGFLLAYALLLNLYFICKNGLHVPVNCWFCNRNTRVAFAERNSFQCPFCHQYNGFDKDGGYNRVIEEQHGSAPTPPSSSPKAANGLCEACNRHQQLKVVHLANYEPLRAADYDKEIEHFEAQLEKAFALCKPCTRIVKATIRRQNAWIFGNLLKTPGQLPREAKRLYQRLSPARAVLLLLSMCSLGAFCGLLPKNVRLPSHVFNFDLSYWLEGKAPPQCSSMLALCTLGFVVELLVGRSPDALLKANSLLAWGVLGLIAGVPFKPDTALYCDTLQVFCSLYLTYLYGATCLPKEKRPPKKRRKRAAEPSFKSPELNEHFNELNIGTPTAPQGRTASPNPFTGCCYGAGPDVAFVERPPRTLLSPSRLDNVTSYADHVIGGQGLLRTRYVSGFYREGPYWAPVYSAKADYFCPN